MGCRGGRRAGVVLQKPVAEGVHNGVVTDARNSKVQEESEESANKMGARNSRDVNAAREVPGMENLSDAVGVRVALFTWWHANARDLPWRFGRTTPWGVLVCEVMSQQTQMSRVVPYWTTWMRVWPDTQALAKASTAEVITAWGRLGYPRRALRLQECARVVEQRCGGELPRSYDELMSLPGIGDYTASAVMSFAYGKRIAVIDTNVRRVLSRVFLGVESRGGAAPASERELAVKVLPCDEPGHANGRGACGGEFGKTLAAESAVGQERQRGRESQTVPVEHDGPERGGRFAEPRTSTVPVDEKLSETASQTWNQAVMELGAIVCTAKAPLCDSCPLAGQCAFLAAGRPCLGEGRTRPRQRFNGTDRQVRGLVLNALRALAPGENSLSRERVEGLWGDRVQLDQCIASLDDDRLVEILPDGSVRLPR